MNPRSPGFTNVTELGRRTEDSVGNTRRAWGVGVAVCGGGDGGGGVE